MRIRDIGTITAVAVFLMLFNSTPGICADVAKIGVINFQKILENSEAGKSAKKELTTEGQSMESDLKSRSDEIKALQQMLERDTGVLSKEARDEKKWELDRKIDEAKALKKKYDRKIQELQAQLLSTIRQSLVSLIHEYGQKEGYLLIVEDISVVYAPKSIDLTDTIIKLYNEKYATPGAKTQGSGK